MGLEFYRCKICGNIITFVHASGAQVVCCGETMTKLAAGEVDASQEKHVPVVKQEGNLVTVTVGSVVHPMLKEHYIEWIALETKQGHQIKWLKPGEEPVATFALVDGDEVVAAYEYCNLHSLWKA